MDEKNIEVFILCGGKGTRLRSVVSDVPKPLAEVGGYPFLHWVLKKLSLNGFSKVKLLTGYKHEHIESFCGKGDKWGLTFTYSIESSPLGTGGALKKAINESSGDQILIVNGDTYLDIDYAQFMKKSKREAVINMALVKVDNSGRYGAVELLPSGQISSFKEKNDSLKPSLINAGVYMINRKLLKFPSMDIFSFEEEVLRKEVSFGRVYGASYECGFIDIGIPADFEKAQTYIPTLV